MEEKAVKRVQSSRKTIACSFCLAMVDDVCISRDSGVSICVACLKFATEEVAKAKKMTEIACDLSKIATKMAVTTEEKAADVSREARIEELRRMLDPQTPDDVA